MPRIFTLEKCLGFASLIRQCLLRINFFSILFTERLLKLFNRHEGLACRSY